MLCEHIFWLVPVRYRPNAAYGGWSYERDFVLHWCEGDTPGLKWLHIIKLNSSHWHCMIYFDLYCWLLFTWQGTQSTVLELFLDIYKCTNASEFISWHKTPQESMLVAKIMAYSSKCTHSYWSSSESLFLNDRPLFHYKGLVGENMLASNRHVLHLCFCHSEWSQLRGGRIVNGVSSEEGGYYVNHSNN